MYVCMYVSNLTQFLLNSHVFFSVRHEMFVAFSCFVAIFRFQVEFFTNERSLKQRLQLYFIKNQRSSELLALHIVLHLALHFYT